jgi:hypothetical protein
MQQWKLNIGCPGSPQHRHPVEEKGNHRLDSEFPLHELLEIQANVFPDRPVRFAFSVVNATAETESRIKQIVPLRIDI